ncbi:MAG: AI-2E family transporter [Pyrinomonadaceae bacterium]
MVGYSYRSHDKRQAADGVADKGGSLKKSMNQREQNTMEAVAETTATAVAEASWPQTRAILRIIFIALFVAATIWLVYALEEVLLLVVLAIFFAYLISPLVEFVRRPIKLRNRQTIMLRSLAIGVVYLALFGGIGLAAYVLVPKLGDQISEFAERAPTYLLTARGRAEKVKQVYQRFQLPRAAREAVGNAASRTIRVRKVTCVKAPEASSVGWLTFRGWS